MCAGEVEGLRNLRDCLEERKGEIILLNEEIATRNKLVRVLREHIKLLTRDLEIARLFRDDSERLARASHMRAATFERRLGEREPAKVCRTWIPADHWQCAKPLPCPDHPPAGPRRRICCGCEDPGKGV